MSTKLNAEELAINAYPVNIVTDTQNILDTEQVKRIGYAAAIREVAQPIADERDELRDAIVDAIASFDDGDLDTANISRLRAILKKYPKP